VQQGPARSVSAPLREMDGHILLTTDRTQGQ
jgi:hypothetical protein